MTTLLKIILISIFITIPLASADQQTDIKAARVAALNWLQLLDQQDYDKSWDESANLFKAQMKKKSWGKKIDNLRKKIGSFQARKISYTKFMTVLPGAPVGKYVVLQFSSSFKNHEQAVETITPMQDSDGKWRVSGYFIK